jgi:hypothetical protein
MAVQGKTRTIGQLRHDIDSGRTGDKVAAGDPAAPLGADDRRPARPFRAAGWPVRRSNLRDACHRRAARASGCASRSWGWARV